MREFSVNSGFLYGLTVFVVAFMIAQSAFFLIKALRRAKELGISTAVVRKTIASSALFTIAPAVAILLGVITLSKFLGFPLPWLRLSVIGALTYELPAATTTATGIGLDISQTVTDPRAFTAIAWVMTLGIIPGLFVILFGLKKIQSGIVNLKSKDEKWGNIFLTCIFLGMISAFVGVLFADIRTGLAGWIPIAVALASAAIMCVLAVFIKVLKWQWLEQYALPISMLGAMALSIPITSLMGG
jgi:hypothetical protein